MNTKTTEPISALDKEIQEHYRQNATESYEEVARHFANWQREQMMKDAIDLKINRDTLYDLKPIIHEKYLDYKIGDKVKVIIVKEG